MYYPRGVYRAIERLRGRREPRQWPSSFADRLTHPIPSLSKVVRLMRERGTSPDLSGAVRIPIAQNPRLPEVSAGDVAVTWIGHATCLVHIGGLVVLTDPVWSHRLPGVKSRLTPPGLPFDALPPVDAILISHNHFDHLDLPTMKRFPRDVRLLVPAGLGWWFRRYGFRAVTEHDWWESTVVGDVRFEFTPGHHWSRRSAFDACQSLWGGWMLTDEGAGAGRVFFAGDSAYGKRFAEIGARLPGAHLALLPVGAYAPRWFMKPLHMDPAEAVKVCGEIGAERLVPIHWGTFPLSAEPVMGPLTGVRDAWDKAGRPKDQLWDLAIGESRVLSRTPAA